MNLEKVSTAELERELERRRSEEAAKQRALPAHLLNPDFEPLRDRILALFSEAVEEQFLNRTAKQQIFEVAVEAVFGPSFWEWRRKQVW